MADLERAVRDVDAVLDDVYRAHAQGQPAEDILDTFLGTLECWLTLTGIAEVNLLFDRVDLARAPGSLGLLLLATTRLTREHFARRDAFVNRLRAWLIGRDGRTERAVDDVLRGLRE